ncbi:NADP-dependent oxidoreductase [Mumia zhuanghuii]|uniref:NADP-dependent oxidoreductase n=1 Tax=Mumia zhuanghuii TaxID=2585211 RepID=A0A5C4LU95_9ACTN|nr:NADP-dependent oxidoreductase [Mumia zhuanghuii]TNC22004.1 NADP-dependent oxidoreductase [Mumia zhuanghuii]
MDTRTTYRTAVVRVPAGPDSVELIDVPRRALGAGQLRVRIEAAAVNPADVWVTDGFFHSIGMIHQPEQTGLGWDFAGVVTATDTDLAIPVGARVAGMVPGFDRDFGSFAQEVTVQQDWVAVVPDDLSLTAAATVPLNALTAGQIVDLLGDGNGRHLLVTGAAGAVGSFVVPLARDRGWVVSGFARASDEAFVRGLGAEFVSAPSRGWDAVADTALLQEDGAALVRDGGTFVGVRPAALPTPGRGVAVRAVSVVPDASRLATLLEMAARDVLRTRIVDVLPLEKVSEALRNVAAGGVRGRYVLTP